MTSVQTQPAEQGKEELISGSEAIAIACSMADVDVITAYPIRPYDTVMQYVSKLKADGAFDCDFIVAESEHSQFEIVNMPHLWEPGPSAAPAGSAGSTPLRPSPSPRVCDYR